MDIDQYEASLQDGQATEPSLEEAIQQIKSEPAPEPTPEVKADDPSDKEPEPEKKEPEPEPTKEEKPKQTPEENARFAEQRRQQQLERRVQEEIAKLQESHPAFKTAKLLESMYGMPVDQIVAQLEAARIEQEAKNRNVPVETVRAEQAQREQASQSLAEAQRLQEENNRLQFQMWENRVISEQSQLANRPEMSFLQPQDFDDAKRYMLEIMKNPNATLEEAVYALHGSKITDKIREIARNDALAEISGRTTAPLPPQGGKPSPTAVLTEDQKYAAKMMGLSEEDYLKWMN